MRRAENRELYCPYCWEPLKLDGSCSGGYDGHCASFPAQYVHDHALRPEAHSRVYIDLFTPQLRHYLRQGPFFEGYHRRRKVRLGPHRVQYNTPLRMGSGRSHNL